MHVLIKKKYIYEPAHEIMVLRPKTNICVFRVSQPYLGFCPDPEHFIVKFEENSVKNAEKSCKM